MSTLAVDMLLIADRAQMRLKKINRAVGNGLCAVPPCPLRPRPFRGQ